jgi:hypothetical protein
MLSRFREFTILRIHCFTKSKILEANPSGDGCGQATMTIGPSAGDGSTEFQASYQ